MGLLSADKKNNVRNKRVIRFTSLIVALLMLLTSCGDNTPVTSSKKKKIIKKRRKATTSSQTDNSSQDDTSSDFYFEDDTDDDLTDSSSQVTSEDEDEGEDLKKTALKDNSFTNSTVPAAYSKLVWADEFNGTELDKSIWASRPNNGDGDDIVKQGIDNKDYLEVKDGALHMYNRHIFDAYDPLVQYGSPDDIDTGVSMNYRFGYLEMCAKLPFRNGSWASWWLVNPTLSKCVTPEAVINDRDYSVEVDIFELFGSTSKVTPNLHKWWRPGTTNYEKYYHTQWSGIKTKYEFDEIDNLPNEWHVYGYEWTPTYMAMYVDGVEYQRFDLTYNYDGYQDMHAAYTNLQYIIIGPSMITPLSKQLTGAVDNDNLPFEYAIDWMRLYQNPNESGNLIYTK